jgi:hypothetical protein
MSHFSTLKTRLADRRHLVQALRDLGHAVEEAEGELWIRGFAGQKTAVEIRVPTDGGQSEIGFRRGEAGAYDLVADWYCVKEVEPAGFARRLAQRYAYNAAVDQLAAQGFDLVQQEAQEDGTIRVVVRRMA